MEGHARRALSPTAMVDRAAEEEQAPGIVEGAEVEVAVKGVSIEDTSVRSWSALAP